MPKEFTAADFFCGAGGWSEGLRMAGIDVVFALDNWKWAQKTHKLNHPDCRHPGLDCHEEFSGDILSIEAEDIDSFVPDTNIIVGSPPCVTFSSSNRAGKADKSSGIALTLKFLQIVAIKKHKAGSSLGFWLMENVPNSRKHLADDYTFDDLGINKTLMEELGISGNPQDIAVSLDRSKERVFDAADYGAPQHRKRFITGEFPLPKQKEEQITLGRVIEALSGKGKIQDPVYPDVKLEDSEITDHGYDTRIHRFEWRQAQVKKEQGRYYGRMSFPEDVSRPSRTVMATRSVISRESMILEGDNDGEFRAPTIREVASLMSFPITYQFQAPNETSKYRLVGNAVCPALSYAIGKAINPKLRRRVFAARSNGDELKRDLRKNPPRLRQPRNKHEKANFAEIVPDLKIKNFRVELDNSLPKKSGTLAWRASIHHATGKDSMKHAFPTQEELDCLFDQLENGHLRGFKSDLESTFRGRIPSAEAFQKQYVEVDAPKEFLNPLDALQMVKDLVDKHFPEDQFTDRTFLNRRDWTKQEPIIEFNRMTPKHIPIRICAAATGALHISELTE